MAEVDGEVDRDEVARRAHELAENGDGSQSDEDNWLQAERELRAAKETSVPTKRTRKKASAAAVNAVPEAN